jgi:hypothetical protein
MTDLSPQAQAVLDAAFSAYWSAEQEAPNDEGMIAAAALRAAADQVVPEEPELNPLKAWSVEDWNHMNATKYQREECRRQLFAIAAELEGGND